MNFEDNFQPIKILAGERVFELLALRRTSNIFGITEAPWAAAAFQIEALVVQMESHLNEWDALAIDETGKVRLIRHNMSIYDLQCKIPPDITGLQSNFFYNCTLCNAHIFQCEHLRRQSHLDLSTTPTESESISACPECSGKVQDLGGEMCFCLDCKWESVALREL